jgi:oxygen-dependent protoporphyrinogen oxidase
MRLLCASNGLRSRQRPLISAIRGQQRAYNAAVIGAGITGLTAAWQLAQDPQCSRITLYEKSARLGGWLDSETIPVEGGEVVFEYGPRTLRSAMPASLPLLYLVNEPRVYCPSTSIENTNLSFCWSRSQI